MSDPTMTRTVANPETINFAAEIVCTLRPDWDLMLVRVILNSHRDQVDSGDLVVAAIRAAQNPNFHTPKAIGWRGPHWDGANRVPPDVAPRSWCGVCGKPEPRCYSERLADDDHQFEPTRKVRR